MLQFIREETVALDKLQPTEHQLHINVSEEEFKDLVDSLKKQGQLEPLTVVERGEKYVILSGNTRYYALKAAGIPAARVRVVKFDSPEEEAAFIFHSNVRVSVNPLDEAEFYKSVLPLFGMDVEKAANALKVAPSRIKERLALVDLPDDVKDALRNQEISIGVAKWLGKITDDSPREVYLNAARKGGATIAMAQKWYYDWKFAKKTGMEITQQQAEEIVKESQTYLLSPCDICGGKIKFGEQANLFGHRVCIETAKQLIQAKMAELAEKEQKEQEQKESEASQNQEPKVEQ